MYELVESFNNSTQSKRVQTADINKSLENGVNFALTDCFEESCLNMDSI